MSSPNKKVIGRAEFVKQLVKAGFRYVDAIRAYDSFMSTIADGVATGSKICFNDVGSLSPVVVPPRQVRMGCARVPGSKKMVTKEFFLDSRLKFKFTLFKGFIDKHHLDWSQ